MRKRFLPLQSQTKGDQRNADHNENQDKFYHLNDGQNTKAEP